MTIDSYSGLEQLFDQFCCLHVLEGQKPACSTGLVFRVLRERMIEPSLVGCLKSLVDVLAGCGPFLLADIAFVGTYRPKIGHHG